MRAGIPKRVRTTGRQRETKSFQVIAATLPETCTRCKFGIDTLHPVHILKTAMPTTHTTRNSTSADVITVGEITASITLPTSEIRDFYNKAREIAGRHYANSPAWRSHPEHQALVAGSSDTEWITSRNSFNRATIRGIPSNKGILDRIRRKMKTEPTGQISFRITGELWEKIQIVANHYGISPADHCRCCFGYYAILWRKESRKCGEVQPEPASELNAVAQVIPFMPHRATRRWHIPAIA